MNKTTLKGLNSDTLYDLRSYVLIPSTRKIINSEPLQIRTLSDDSAPSEIKHANQTDEALNQYNKLDLNVIWHPVEGTEYSPVPVGITIKSSTCLHRTGVPLPHCHPLNGDPGPAKRVRIGCARGEPHPRPPFLPHEESLLQPAVQRVDLCQGRL